MNNEALQALLRDPRIQRGSASAVHPAGIPTGCAELDAALPGGGWPTGALAEILIERHGLGELELLMPALAHLSRGNRVIAWVAPPLLPYAPALAGSGLDLRRLLIVRAQSPADALWSAEQALRSGSCAAVLAWAEPSTRWLRRLQLAAEAGAAWGVLFRTARVQGRASYAALRLRVSPGKLELLKCRGGRPRTLHTAWRPPA
jgi:hypothetical protein